MLHLEMNVFTRRKKLKGISVCWVFTKKEKSQSISVHSTKTENNCTTKNVHWNHTDPDFKTNWFAIWIFDTTDGFKLPSINSVHMSYPPPHLTQQSVSSHVKSLATMLIINWLCGTFSALDTQDIFMRMFNYLTGRLIVWWVTTDCWNVETVDICNWVDN